MIDPMLIYPGTILLAAALWWACRQWSKSQGQGTRVIKRHDVPLTLDDYPLDITITSWGRYLGLWRFKSKRMIRDACRSMRRQDEFASSSIIIAATIIEARRHLRESDVPATDPHKTVHEVTNSHA